MPVPTGVLSTSVRSALWLHWRARDLSLKALTGQLGIFTRAAQATMTDSLGTSATLGYSAPRFNPIDLDGNGSPESMAMRLGGGSSEALYLPFAALPRGMTIYTKWVARGVATAGAGVIWAIASAANADPKCYLYVPSAGNLSGFHSVGGTTRQTATLTIAANDVLESRVVLKSDGSVYLGLTRNGAAESVTAATAALTFGAAWSDTRCWLGSINAVSPGDCDILVQKISGGELTMQQMRDAF